VEGLPASKSCGIVAAPEKWEQRKRKNGKVLEGEPGRADVESSTLPAILDEFTVEG
jgi:hypothetical protein